MYGLLAPTAHKKIFREHLTFNYKICEAVDGEDKSYMYVQGVAQRADVKNGNGRIYPRSIWDSIMHEEDPGNALALVRDNRMLGHVEHPDDGLTMLDKCSHLITKLWMEDDGTVLTRIKILNTPQGKIIQDLFKAGVKVGISSRGKGTSSVRGDVEYVNDDYQLETFDFVYNPSTPGAYQTMVHESLKDVILTQESVKMDLSKILAFNGTLADIRKLMESANPLDRSRYQATISEGLVALESAVAKDSSLKSVAENVIKESKQLLSVLNTNNSGNSGDQSALISSLVETVNTLRSEVKSLKETADKNADDDKLNKEDTDKDPKEGEDDDKKSEGMYTYSMKCPSCHHESRKDVKGFKKLRESCKVCGTAMKLEMAYPASETDDKDAGSHHDEDDAPVGREGNKASIDKKDAMDTAEDDDQDQQETDDQDADDKKKEGDDDQDADHKEADANIDPDKISKGEAIVRLRAAYQLVETLVVKVKGLSKSNKVLRERYEEGIQLIGDLVEKHRKAAVQGRIRESVAKNPKLQKLTHMFKECKSVTDVDAKVKELSAFIKESVAAPKRVKSDIAESILNEGETSEGGFKPVPKRSTVDKSNRDDRESLDLFERMKATGSIK